MESTGPSRVESSLECSRVESGCTTEIVAGQTELSCGGLP